jgi:adenosylcobinamide-GDP ribazoletransferase
MVAEEQKLMLRSLWLALGMATRLPLPDPGPVLAAEVARALSWLPLVGALIGAALVGVDGVVKPHFADAPASAGLVVVWMALTGAVPLASVIRICQALHDRRLTLRTPGGQRASGRPWVGGAVGLGTLIMKFALLALLPAQRRWEALLLAPLWGRQMTLCALLLLPLGAATPYRVREVRRATRRRQLWVALLPVAVTGLVLREWAAPVVIVLAGSAWVVLRPVERALGGLLPDLAEAAAEWTELLVLMCYVALAGNLPAA